MLVVIGYSEQMYSIGLDIEWSLVGSRSRRPLVILVKMEGGAFTVGIECRVMVELGHHNSRCIYHSIPCGVQNFAIGRVGVLVSEMGSTKVENSLSWTIMLQDGFNLAC